MVKKTSQTIKHKFNRLFAKPKKSKVNKQLHDRRSTLTDAEILQIRKDMKIEVKPKGFWNYNPHAYEKGM